MENKTVTIEGNPVIVPAKPWYMSKQIWLGVVVTLVGISTFLESQYPGISAFVTASGILNIIVRNLSFTAIK